MKANINTLAEIIGIVWIVVKDGDPRVSSIYKRHYSCYQYKDGRRSQAHYRNRHLVLGPGEKLVLLSADCRAVFGWRKFISSAGEEGINCAFFRNERAFGGAVLSSDLIMAAELLAWQKWPGERLYTYVDGAAVKSSNPGYCFLMAGWRRLERKTASGLLLFEKYKPDAPSERVSQQAPVSGLGAWKEDDELLGLTIKDKRKRR